MIISRHTNSSWITINWSTVSVTEKERKKFNKMVSETLCKYNQFGYCKLQDECNNLHVNDVCKVSDCGISNCNLRHPRPCKYHAANGFCKFGTSCRYTHIVLLPERKQKIIQSLHMDMMIMNHQTTNLMRYLTNSTPCVQKFWSNPWLNLMIVTGKF